VAITTEQLSSLIGDIYCAAYDQAEWPTLLENIRSAFNGSKACVARIGPNVTVADAIATSGDPAYALKFVAEYTTSPGVFYDPIAAIPVGSIYNDHTLFGGNSLRATKLWNEWMVPQDMCDGLACKLGARGSSFWIIDVQRAAGQQGYNGVDVQLLSIIAPHIRRAINLSQSLGLPNGAGAAFDCVSGAAMFLDSRLNIISMNRAAEALLDRYNSYLSVHSGTLSIDSSRATSRLRQLVKDSCATMDGPDADGGSGMLMEFGGTVADVGVLAVSVCPFVKTGIFASWSEPLAIAFFRDLSLKLPESFPNQIKDMFGLTTKEAKLASLLTQGLSLRNAAASQQIAFSTARAYMETIFLKTGAHQQSQLVAILKTLQPLNVQAEHSIRARSSSL
jgi:DNA-binding CsgD family transcriptional regulator